MTALVTVNPTELVIVACNVYVPAAANVAVTLFAAFVPLALNCTGAGGVPVAAQVYVRLLSALRSAPRTESTVVFPVGAEGLAAAAVATVGGEGVRLRFENVLELSSVLLCAVTARPASAAAGKLAFVAVPTCVQAM